MKARTCWRHVKTAASEAEKPRSFQEKSVYRKRDEFSQNSGACVGTPAQQCKRERERERDGTQEVFPRTTSAPVVLNASTDHTMVESHRREDRTAFIERQRWTED